MRCIILLSVSAAEVFQIIGSVLVAILILLLMITVHEFGHFIAGKILGFQVDEFAIGFGPALFKKKNKFSGLFSIRLLPLGGYCAFAGENEQGEEGEHSFNKKAPWRRIIVLLAGATMNYLTALLLIVIMFTAFGQPAFQIKSVQQDTAISTEYHLVDGDVILEVDGRDIYLVNDIVYAISGKKQGEKVTVKVDRGGKQQTVQVQLRADCNFKNSSQTSLALKALGAGTYVAEDGKEYYDVTATSYQQNFFVLLGKSFIYSGRIAGSLFRVVGELLTGRLGLDAVGGPVSTIKVTSELATQNWQSFLEIAAYIGVNLAVFNVLPIPALDGSKVIFCLIEWIFRKPVPRKIEAVLHAVGFVLILGFAVLVDVLSFL